MRAIRVLGFVSGILVVGIGDARADESLSAGVIQKHFEADHLPDVRDCWVRHAARKARADGRFTLRLLIAPTGAIRSLDVKGIRGAGFERCLREASEGWRYPDGRAVTDAEIPVTMVKTWAPGAGPMKR